MSEQIGHHGKGDGFGTRIRQTSGHAIRTGRLPPLYHPSLQTENHAVRNTVFGVALAIGTALVALAASGNLPLPR